MTKCNAGEGKKFSTILKLLAPAQNLQISMPFPMQPRLYISVLKLSVLVFTSALCILANFHVYLLLCTCRTVILLGMGPISTYLKSAVIFEERKIDSTPVKSLFCFQDFKGIFYALKYLAHAKS